MSAYTDAQKIAAHLGVTLTAAQIVQAGVVAQAASDWIDQYTGKSWQAVSPVTDEPQPVIGDRVYLNKRPVAAITTVQLRAATSIGLAWVPLTAGQYELFDAQNGLLLVMGWGDGMVKVTYTHTAIAPPAVIALAATMIAASWLGPTMLSLPAGLESVGLGQSDIVVKFADDGADIPKEALSLLASYRTVVIA